MSASRLFSPVLMLVLSLLAVTLVGGCASNLNEADRQLWDNSGHTNTPALSENR